MTSIAVLTLSTISTFVWMFDRIFDWLVSIFFIYLITMLFGFTCFFCIMLPHVNTSVVLLFWRLLWTSPIFFLLFSLWTLRMNWENIQLCHGCENFKQYATNRNGFGLGTRKGTNEYQHIDQTILNAHYIQTTDIWIAYHLSFDLWNQ